MAGTTVNAAHVGEVIVEESKSESNPDNRRVHTEAQRMTYIQQKRLRIELMNRAGKWALGTVIAVVIAATSWVVSEVRAKMSQTEDLRLTAVETKSKLAEHTETIKEMREEFKAESGRRRIADEQRADRELKILLEMQTLNSQVAAIRMERARETQSQGARR